MFFAYRDLSLALLIVLAALPVVRAVFARRRSERRAAKRTARAVVRIGRYRVRRQLGAGGMGVVYEACDAKRGERVAVKVVRGELTARRLERFEREIRMLERVRHPNVVSLRDHGVERDGSRYLAILIREAPGAPQVNDVDPAFVVAHRGEVTLVDVREPQEYTGELGHVPGAVLVPLAKLAETAQLWNTDREIVLVCRSGGRSARAATELAKRGFRNLYNLRGGMIAWNAEHLPVER